MAGAFRPGEGGLHAPYRLRSLKLGPKRIGKQHQPCYAAAFSVLVGSILGEAMGVCRIALASLSLVGLGFLAGCSGNPLGRQAISGSVKVDGVPLEKGTISFQPLENGQTSSGAVIAGGNYSIPRDKGLPPGSY